MQTLDPRSVIPILVALLVVWALYRRVRRSFGRQPVNPVRLRLRIGLLGLIGALLMVASAREPALLATLLGGAACGASLAYIGLRHTKFEVTAQGRFYTPHTYIGLLVTSLFIGRLVFRFLPGVAAAPAVIPPDPNPLHAGASNPATLVTFGILLGYYLVYNLGVLWKTRPQAARAYSSIQQP